MTDRTHTDKNSGSDALENPVGKKISEKILMDLHINILSTIYTKLQKHKTYNAILLHF